MKQNVPFLGILFLFVQLSSFAQESQPAKIKLKAYYNYNRTNFYQPFHFSGNEYLWTQPEVINNNIGEFSIGAIIQKKPTQTHEFELMPISIQHSSLNEVKNPVDNYNWEVSGKESTSINSRFRYQLNYIYSKRKCDFYLGLSSMANFFFQNFNPQTSVEFKQSFTQIGLVFGLTPGIEFPINEKLVWSVDIPIGIAGINMKRMNTQDPSIKGEERKQSVFNGELWHQGFQIRVGLGFNL